MDIAKEKARLSKYKKDELVDQIINRTLNDFLADHADIEESEEDSGPGGHGKRIPYMGWYWRDVDIVSGVYTIADCGHFIGFCENNKWDYPERYLDPKESDQVTALICEAYSLSRGGGNLAEITDRTHKKLKEIWDLLQTFSVNKDGWWIHGSLQQGTVAHADTEEEADKLIEMLADAGGGISRYWKTKA